MSVDFGNGKRFAIKLKEVLKHFSSAPALDDWDQNRIIEHVEGIYQFAKFKIGDKVRLGRTPEISEHTNYGWLCGKHYLIKGSVAIVKDCEFYKDRFDYLVEFEKETYIHSDTKKEMPVVTKHLYSFPEYDLIPFNQDLCGICKEPSDSGFLCIGKSVCLKCLIFYVDTGKLMVDINNIETAHGRIRRKK